jgi:hypothetical protein
MLTPDPKTTQQVIFRKYNEGDRRGRKTRHIRNRAIFGYVSGKVSTATTERMLFSTGVFALNVPSNLTGIKYGHAGISDTKMFGYWVNIGGSPYTGTDRTVFSTGVNSASGNLTSIAHSYNAGLSDGSIFGYALGSAPTSAVTDRVLFSTGIFTANAASDLSVGRDLCGDISDGSIYGYVIAGHSSVYVVTADRLVFSTGVTSANVPSDASVASAPKGLSDNVVYGYLSIPDRLVFSTGVTSAYAGAGPSDARYGYCSYGDGIMYGYWSGGNLSGDKTTTDRLIYSTGVCSAYATGNLVTARRYPAGMSDGSV